jgi:predicted permease
VTPGYFPTVELALRRGRLLDDRDRAGTVSVAVVSESFARAVWPGDDPLGKRFAAGGTTVETVGVVTDVKHMKLEEQATPMVYLARAQEVMSWHVRRTTIVLRTAEDPSAIVPAVRAQVRAIDDRLPMSNVLTMRQVIAASATPPRFRTLLIGTFSALALLLATLGIYGVVSYSVTQRSREMAIRMALGARARGVLGLVLRQGLAPVAVGIGVGLLAAMALSRVLAAVLFEVTTTDALVFTGVPALMLLVAAAATIAPARRATRVAPMEALRQD